MKVFLSILIFITQLTPVAQKPAASVTTTERVEIVVFSDFQCPFCAQFAQPIRELQSKGIEGIQTSVEFKHFPLSIHPAALLAHRAALAAGEQGKFWEMHDLLFANQSALQQDDLLRYAAGLGLNLIRFRKDLGSESLKQLIEANLAEGQNLRVQGTPTFFVNGRQYSGARSLEQLKEIVRNEQQRLRAMSEVTDSQLSRGPSAAPVTLEFFADLQSPVTRLAMEKLDQLSSKYPSAVRIQFRSFPLAFHPLAPLAHEAAMAAAAQGRFWEFIKYILDHQDSLREQDLIAEAGRLGLDESKFAQVVEQRRYAPRVEADLEAGLKRGIHGSPVIFVNGNRIDGVPGSDMLARYVESAIAAVNQNSSRR